MTGRSQNNRPSPGCATAVFTASWSTAPTIAARQGAATLAATLLWLRQRLGFGFGLGIADGLSQHLA